MWAMVPMILVRTSFSNPFIMDKTKIRAATPIKIPAMEIKVKMETNPVFLLEAR